MATTLPPADSHIASVPIDTDSGGNFVVACTPDPPIPVEGCNLWDNGDVSVRIQRRNNMFDHSEASYIHPTVASKVAGTYSGGQSSSDSGNARPASGFSSAEYLRFSPSAKRRSPGMGAHSGYSWVDWTEYCEAVPTRRIFARYTAYRTICVL